VEGKRTTESAEHTERKRYEIRKSGSFLFIFIFSVVSVFSVVKPPYFDVDSIIEGKAADYGKD
jgi:hypothetical protein